MKNERKIERHTDNNNIRSISGTNFVVSYENFWTIHRIHRTTDRRDSQTVIAKRGTQKRVKHQRKQNIHDELIKYL